MSVVKIENLTVQYLGEETNALDGVSLEIQKGEFVILVSTHNCESEENNVEELYLNLKGYLPLKDLSVVISKISGVKKNLLYKKFLQLSKKSR